MALQIKTLQVCSTRNAQEGYFAAVWIWATTQLPGGKSQVSTSDLGKQGLMDTNGDECR